MYNRGIVLFIPTEVIHKHLLLTGSTLPSRPAILFRQDKLSKRLDLHESEFRSLLEAKKENSISAQKEERFAYLYGLLRSYGEVDELPVELLQPNIEQKIDSLIGELDQLLTKLDANKDGE